MAINTHQADHVEYIQDSDGIKHYLNAEYLDGHSYGDIKSSVANHYTPAADSSAQLSVDASSTTAATWDKTALVTGVNLQRDSKGHVTGVTVDSIKMPANPNNHQAIKTLNTTNTAAQATSASETMTGSSTINLHKVSKTGDYNDLNNKPTIPTVNNGKLSIQKNGSNVAIFPANSSSNVIANINVPTKVSELVNDSGYVKGTVLSDGGGYATVIANEGNAFSVTNSTVTSNDGGTINAIFSIDSSGVHITKSGAKSDVVTANNLKKINNNSLIGSGNINIPTMSHIHQYKGPYSADNNKDHTVYSGSSTASGNGNGCLIMVHGHIVYQSGYINITDTTTVYTDYDSYAVQAGQEGYWGKSWVTATAFFEPGRTMYVHAKGVESIYVIFIYF